MLRTKRNKNLGVTVLASVAFFALAAALVMLAGCVPNPDTDPVRNAEVGKVVKFGEYEWRVLEKQDDKALLITESVIDARAYNEAQEATTWEACTLRAHLNGEFFDSFTDGQKAAIADTANSNPKNSRFGTSGGNDTTDKVFLLSFDEAGKYFLTDGDREAISQVPDANPASIYNGEHCRWWLRSPGHTDVTAAAIVWDGRANDSGVKVDSEDIGVRPAMWVNF